MKGILGRKVGMTTVFTTDGKQIPVTVVSVEPNVVTQIKTKENDGYDAIQLGAFSKREKLSNKPEMGHAKKANTEPKRFLKEIRGVNVSDYTVGQVLEAGIFEAGEIVDVTGTSKGKGFQGVMKRWGFHGGRATHGSKFHREAGGTGTINPQHTFKNVKMPGRMGFRRVTVQNLKVVKVDPELNVILVRGAVPGNKDCTLIVKSAVKK